MLLLRGHVVAPAAPATGFPSAIVNVSWSTNPLSAPSYSDVSAYTEGFSIKRGRSYEYDRMESGTADVQLSNRDSRFNPANTSGPYYPNVKPTRRLRVQADYSGVYDLFLGFTDGYPQQYNQAGFDRRVRTRAIDMFYALAQYKFPALADRRITDHFPAEQSGTRIVDVLINHVGIPTGMMQIDGGNTLIAASGDLAGQTALEHILLVAETENGKFFATKDGKLRFLQRHAVINKPALTATFGDNPGELPYLGDLDVQQDDTKLVNSIEITLPDDTVVTATDATSKAAHFTRSMSKSLPFALANEAQDAANYMVARLKDAQIRMGELKLSPLADAALWPVCLGAEIGQMMRFRLRPKGGGTMIDQYAIVDGVGHDVKPGQWVTTLQLTAVDPKDYWTLESTQFGNLEQTTYLAY